VALIRTTQDGTATLEKCNRAAAFTYGFGRILRPLQGAVCFGVGLSIMLHCSLATAQQPTQMPSKAQSDISTDGRHDFDFEVGNWSAHVQRIGTNFLALSPRVRYPNLKAGTKAKCKLTAKNPANTSNCWQFAPLILPLANGQFMEQALRLVFLTRP
jgi:hypothetical protein